MATLGRWTGSSTGVFPTTSWAAPSGLFPTEARNDSSAYSFASSTSTLTLPSSGLADGYLILARVEIACSHNNRCTVQARIVQASGTGDFVGPRAGGYARNANNDQVFVSVWAVVNNPSAGSTYRFEWSRTGAGTSAGQAVTAAFDIIPLYYSDIGLFTGSDASLLGGTSRNVVALNSDVAAGTNITRSGNTITLAGDTKRYLILSGQYYEGRGGRTQRIFGHKYDSTDDLAAQSYAYYRDASNDDLGGHVVDLLETATANRTLDLTCYRGDGIANGDGGADSDGSTPSLGEQAIAVIELSDDAEVWRSHDPTGLQELNGPAGRDLNIARSAGVDFSDSASFTRASDTGVNVEAATDVLFGANIWAASTNVSSGTRGEYRSNLTVNGAEETYSLHGNYIRGNQGSLDTFGWAANPVGFVSASAGDDIGVSVTHTGDRHDIDTQAGTVGFWALNLDTLEQSGPVVLTAETGVFTLTGQGVNLTKIVPASQPIGGSMLGFGPLAAGPLGAVGSSLRDLSLSVEAGVFTLTGQAVTFDRATAVEAGSYSLTGQDATLLDPVRLSADAESFSLAGQGAALVRALLLDAATGDYSLTGQDAGFLRDLLIVADQGSLALTGQDATLIRDLAVSAETAAFGLAGQEALLVRDLLLAGESASFALTGQDAGLLRDLLLDGETGSFAFAGQSADFVILVTTFLESDAGSFTLAGQDAKFRRDIVLDAENGDFALSGQTAGLLRSLLLGGDAGAFALTGQEASLVRQIPLAAEAGAISLSGQDAGLLRYLLIDALSGTYSVAGQDVVFKQAGLLQPEAGDFALAGQSASLTRALLLESNVGAFTLSGQDASLIKDLLLDADVASFTLTGQDTTLAVQTFVDAESGAFAFAGQDATLLDPVRITADVGAFVLSGQEAVLRRTLPISAETGDFALNGQDAALGQAFVIITEAGAFVLSGQDIDTTYERVRFIGRINIGGGNRFGGTSFGGGNRFGGRIAN